MVLVHVDLLDLVSRRKRPLDVLVDRLETVGGKRSRSQNLKEYQGFPQRKEKESSPGDSLSLLIAAMENRVHFFLTSTSTVPSVISKL